MEPPFEVTPWKRFGVSLGFRLGKDPGNYTRGKEYWPFGDGLGPLDELEFLGDPHYSWVLAFA